MGVIDTWCNLFTPGRIRQKYYEQPVVKQAMDLMKMPDRWKEERTVEQFIDYMDEFGIEKVIIPAWQFWYYRTHTPLWDEKWQDVAEIVQKHPERFAGLYGINPQKGMAGVRELETAVREYGLKGAHISPFGFGPPNMKDFYPFYTKCAELDVPVVVHTGTSVEAMPSEFGRPIHLEEVALYFPELKIVGGHTGWPWTDELISLVVSRPNIYLGASAHMPKYWSDTLVRFINGRGAGRCVYGTTFPMTLHKETLPQIDALELRPASKAELLRETAVRLFKL